MEPNKFYDQAVPGQARRHVPIAGRIIVTRQPDPLARGASDAVG
jgi:hypothetical protein